MLSKLAIIADIHGNVAALEAVLTDIAARKVTSIGNLGDCLSGPPWPRESMDLLKRLRFPTVRGNHDRWLRTSSGRAWRPPTRLHSTA